MTDTPSLAANPARDHERYLAGAALLGDDEAAEIQSRVRAEDFADYPARIVVQAAFDILAAGRRPTAEGVFLLLRDRNLLADLGHNPGEFLADLLALAPTGATVAYAAEQVREWSVRRQVRALAAVLDEEATRPTGSAEELVATAERGLHAIGDGSTSDEPVHIGVVVRDALVRYADQRPRAVVPTGLPELDEAMSGGFRPGELVLVGARTGVGKSALSLRFAEEAAGCGAGVLFFNLEMRTDESLDRMMSGAARVALAKLRGRGVIDADESGRLAAEGDPRNLAGLPLWFHDRPMPVSRIAAITRRYVRRHRAKIVVVDYLQLVTAEDKRAPRYEQVGAISRALKMLAKDAGVTVIAGVQLSREADTNDPPRLSHLRESGSLEQDADSVLLLHRPGDNDATVKVVPIDLLVAKQRNGVSGVSIDLEYVRSRTRFEPRTMPM